MAVLFGSALTGRHKAIVVLHLFKNVLLHTPRLFCPGGKVFVLVVRILLKMSDKNKAFKGFGCFLYD